MAKKYSLILAPAAKRDLKKLPYNVQNQIVFEHLPEIECDPLGVGKPLFGVLKGELSYHFGRNPEYRIIYFIDNDSVVVTIMGSRENLYKRAKRRATGNRKPTTS
jgi:mRNA-degrading endonuclease RelE of RelBE toxin-antitoxin system